MSCFYGTVDKLGDTPRYEDMVQSNVDLRDQIRFCFYPSRDAENVTYDNSAPENVKYLSWHPKMCYKPVIYCKPRKHISVSNLVNSVKSLWDCIKLCNPDFELPHLYVRLDVSNNTAPSSLDYVCFLVSYEINMYIDFSFSDRTAVLHQ